MALGVNGDTTWDVLFPKRGWVHEEALGLAKLCSTAVCVLHAHAIHREAAASLVHPVTHFLAHHGGAVPVKVRLFWEGDEREGRQKNNKKESKRERERDKECGMCWVGELGEASALGGWKGKGEMGQYEIEPKQNKTKHKRVKTGARTWAGEQK